MEEDKSQTHGISPSKPKNDIQPTERSAENVRNAAPNSPPCMTLGFSDYARSMGEGNDNDSTGELVDKEPVKQALNDATETKNELEENEPNESTMGETEAVAQGEVLFVSSNTKKGIETANEETQAEGVRVRDGESKAQKIKEGNVKPESKQNTRELTSRFPPQAAFSVSKFDIVKNENAKNAIAKAAEPGSPLSVLSFQTGEIQPYGASNSQFSSLVVSTSKISDAVARDLSLEGNLERKNAVREVEQENTVDQAHEAAHQYAQKLPAIFGEGLESKEKEKAELMKEVKKAMAAREEALRELGNVTNQMLTLKAEHEAEQAKTIREFHEKVREEVRCQLEREAEIRAMQRDVAIDALKQNADKAYLMLREISKDNKNHHDEIQKATESIGSTFSAKASQLNQSNDAAVQTVHSLVQQHVTSAQSNVVTVERYVTRSQSIFRVLLSIGIMLMFVYCVGYVAFYQANTYTNEIAAIARRGKTCWEKTAILAADLAASQEELENQKREKGVLEVRLGHSLTETASKVNLTALTCENRLHSIHQEYQTQLAASHAQLSACESKIDALKESAYHAQESFKALKRLKEDTEKEANRIGAYIASLKEDASLVERALGHYKKLHSALDGFHQHLSRQQQLLNEQLASMRHAVGGAVSPNGSGR